MSLPGYTWQKGLEITDIKIQTLQDKDSILLSENKKSGCIVSSIGTKYVKCDQNKKNL